MTIFGSSEIYFWFTLLLHLTVRCMAQTTELAAV